MFSGIEKKKKLVICILVVVCTLVVVCLSCRMLMQKKKDTYSRNTPPAAISVNEAIDWIDSKIDNDEGHNLYVDYLSFFCTRDMQFAKYKDEIQGISLIDLKSEKEYTISLLWGENLPFELNYDCDSYETKENDVLFDSSVVSKAMLWEDVKNMLRSIDWDDLVSGQDIIHFDYSRVTFADCNKEDFLTTDFSDGPLKSQWKFVENKMKKVKSKDDIIDKENVIEISRYKISKNDYHYKDKIYIFI